MLKIDPRIADAMVQHALTGGGPLAERKPKLEEAEARRCADRRSRSRKSHEQEEA